MLAADTDLEVGIHGLTLSHAHLDQATDAGLVQRLEGILGQDAAIHILQQELALSIITAVAVGHLRQVVRAEGVELCVRSKLTGDQGSAGDLDHRAEDRGDLNALFRHHLFCDGLQLLTLHRQLCHDADQRDHDLRMDVDTALRAAAGSLEVGAGLHLGQPLVHDAGATAAQTHHRVDFPHSGNDL